MLNLDTHILVASLAGDLSDRELKLVTHEKLAVSDIVFWELAKLVQLKRLVLDLESIVFRRAMSNVTVIPISMRIAQQSTELDFKSNPADEIIAATSVVEDIPLLTRDRNILRSKIVRFA